MSQIKELRYVRQTHGESTIDNSVGARALGRPEKKTHNHFLEPDHKLIATALLDVSNRSFRTEPDSTSLPPLHTSVSPPEYFRLVCFEKNISLVLEIALLAAALPFEVSSPRLLSFANASGDLSRVDPRPDLSRVTR